MPSLYSAGISVHLATAPLAETISPTIVIRKGSQATQQAIEAEEKLKDAVLLREQRVQFPGDGEGFAVNWLGGAPFLQVLSGGDARGLTGSEKHTAGASNITLASTTNPDILRLTPALPTQSAQVGELDAKALVLHVMLSQKTFYNSVIDGKPLHLKIDVFFNGQLANCVMIHQADLRAGAKSLHQVFAGTRVDFLVERPWVIVPPGKNVDGSRRKGKNVFSAQERWQQICNELMKEVLERGVDEKGEMPPTAQYLKELASMAMPSDVVDMQKPGGRSFGVVDVIVTAGIGRKVTDGVRYAKNPMRLVDERYGYEVVEVTELDNNIQEQGTMQPTEKGLASGAKESAIQVGGQDHRLVDDDGEGNVDTDHVLLPGLEAYASLAPTFQDPFTGSRIQPIQLTPPLSYSNSSSLPHASGPSLGQPSAEVSTIQQRKRTFSDFAVDAQRAHAPSPPLRGLEAPRQPGPQFNLNQYDGFMHANPYQMPFADMIVGLDALDPRLSSWDGPESSLTQHSIGSQLSQVSFDPLSSRGMQDVEMTSPPLPSNSFSVPSQNRKVSFGQAEITPFDPHAPPNQTAGNFDLPAGGSFEHPQSSYNSSPLMQQYPGSFPALLPHYVSPFMHPRNRPPPGPPPAVGLFSATQKPKSSRPSNTALLGKDQFHSGLLVKRLVIIGKGKKAILDHYWKTPQQISRKPSPEKIHQAPDKESSYQFARKTLQTLQPSTAPPRRRSGRFMAMETPPPTSPSQTESSAVSKHKYMKKRDSVHDGPSESGQTSLASQLPLLAPKPSAPAFETMAGPRTDSSIAIATVPPSRRRRTVLGVQGPKATTFVVDDPEEILRKKPAKLMSRSASPDCASAQLVANEASSHLLKTPASVLGVQGPKATKFVFDDPEELLRKKPSNAKSRSASPKKIDLPPIKITDTMKVIEQRSVDKATSNVALDLDSSSPLSSLSNTPEMSGMDGANSVDDATPTSLPPPALMMPAKYSQTRNRSSTTAVTMPAPASPITVNLTSPFSPTTPSPLKKKEPAFQTSPNSCRKLPRSPDRLATVDNPPLNQDCSIQYAVSKPGMVDPKGRKGAGSKAKETGVLRQIKGERQGLFGEESVVVGVRFFVAG